MLYRETPLKTSIKESGLILHSKKEVKTLVYEIKNSLFEAKDQIRRTEGG